MNPPLKSTFLMGAQLAALFLSCAATLSEAGMPKAIPEIGSSQRSPLAPLGPVTAKSALPAVSEEADEPEKPLTAEERAVMAKHPESKLGRYYTARSLALHDRHIESYNAYLALKKQFYAREPFPYNQEMAEEAEKAGIWSGALAAYRASLKDPDLTAEDRRSIEASIVDIQNDHASELELHTDFDFLDEGTIWRSEGNYAWDITGALRGLVRVHVDDVRLASTPDLRSGWYAREEGQFGLESAISDQWAVNGWLGASTGLNSSNVLAGFHVEHNFTDVDSLVLEGALNERCTESVLDEAINGRQNRIGLEGNYQFFKGLTGMVSLNGIQYRIDDSTLGNGFDGEYSLDYQVCSQYPGIIVSLHGESSTFNQTGGNPAAFNAVEKPIPNAASLTSAQLTAAENARNDALLNDLVAPTERHGLALSLEHHFSSMVTCRLVNGVDYDFELNKVEYNVLGGITVTPRKNIEVSLDAGYTSAGQGANADSPETLITLAVRTVF